MSDIRVGFVKHVRLWGDDEGACVLRVSCGDVSADVVLDRPWWIGVDDDSLSGFLREMLLWYEAHSSWGDYEEELACDRELYDIHSECYRVLFEKLPADQLRAFINEVEGDDGCLEAE